MNELELIQTLSPNSYKLYRFICLSANEKGVVWDVTREQLMDALNIGENTVYSAIRELKKRELAEVNLYKKMIRLL